MDERSAVAADIDAPIGDAAWRSFTLEDLVGVACFLAGNVIAHRADPVACAQELLAWADGRTDALVVAARAIEHDADQRAAHRLLCRAAALAPAVDERIPA